MNPNEATEILSTGTIVSSFKLSICIATFNRAHFIGATLESIFAQVTEECEVVVLDGASTDCTERVVSEYTRRFSYLRYVRLEKNSGIDQDYDHLVGLARGEYCWLMTDDDVLKEGAVPAVLAALRLNVSVVIVNVESRDLTMSEVLQDRWLEIGSDRVYGKGDMDRLFEEASPVLKYIGCFIIERRLWVERQRKKYFGSLFVHLGVCFQDSLPNGAMLIAEPMISYRLGNGHTFSPKMFETFMIKWPRLVWSLRLSDTAKAKVCTTEPWRSAKLLFLWRGFGFYTLTEYRAWIRPRSRSVRDRIVPACAAVAPGVLVNIFLMTYYFLTRRPICGVQPGPGLDALRDSRFHILRSRLFEGRTHD